MEAVLNAGEHLRIAPEDLYDLSICLLDNADSPRQHLGPPGQAGPVVWRAEESYATRPSKDVLEVLIRSLSRFNQSLLQALAQPQNSERFHTSSQTSPPRLWQTNMIGRLLFYAN